MKCYFTVIVLLELLHEMRIKIVEKDDFYMAAWFVKNSNSCMFSLDRRNVILLKVLFKIHFRVTGTEADP